MIKSNALVVKSNKLIESRYKLTLQEQKLVLAMASKIKKDDKDFKTITLHVEELSDFVGVERDGYYRELKRITKSLLSKVIGIPEPDGLLQVSWLSSAKYFDKEGKVGLSFDPKLKPYLLLLKESFTVYQLRNIVNLNSVYAIRIYELCKQYESLEKRTITIKELKEILGIDKVKYNRYNNFKRKVLDVAKKEINAKTDIQIDYKEKKTGRKVTDLIFHIRKKNITNNYLEDLGMKVAELSQETETETVKYSPELIEFIKKAVDKAKHSDSKKCFINELEDKKGDKHYICVNDKGQLYDGLPLPEKIFTLKKAKDVWERLYRLSQQNVS